MRLIFADSSYFVALAEASDAFHPQAEEFSRLNDVPLITTGAVILELGARYSRSHRRHIFTQILQTLLEDNVEIVSVDSALQAKAVDLFQNRPDKDWSLADCAAFVVMQERGLSQAATSDEHFEQAGFVAILRSGGIGSTHA